MKANENASSFSEFKSSPCNFRSGFLKAEVQKLRENKKLNNLK